MASDLGLRFGIIMVTIDTLLTAEEYGRLPDNGRPTELVRGRIVSEYLDAGVLLVDIVDPEDKMVTAFDANRPGRTLRGDDELTFPAPLAELHVPVRRVFP